MTNDLMYEYKPLYDIGVYFIDYYYKKELKLDDDYSKFILGVKSGNNDAIFKAANILKEIVPDNSFVCVVPSSKRRKRNYMIDVLNLIKNEKGLVLCKIDRTKDVDKKSTNYGGREYETERESITCHFGEIIENKNVFLFDDVSTTGVSMAACRNILLEHKAASVKCVALANTRLNADYYNKIIVGLLMIPKIGRKTASEIIDRINTHIIESNKSIYRTLEDYSSGKRSINLPDFDRFCEYIDDAERILKKQEKQGVIAINKNGNNYPKKFKDISSPPVILFAKGNLSLLHGFNHIALVGSRNATEHGCKVAYRLGQLFAKDNIVVSGLAKGCDTNGHKGCIDANGKTVAILPSPVTNPEPKENIGLAEKIVKADGLLLSEYYLGQSTQRGYYIARDRLQSALSDSVVVVETESEGGTMRTVEYCRDQKRLLACYRHPDRYMNLPQLSGNKLLLESDALQIGNKSELEYYFKQLDIKRDELKKGTHITEQISLI